LKEDEDCKFYEIEGKKIRSDLGLYFIIPEKNLIIFASPLQVNEKTID